MIDLEVVDTGRLLAQVILKSREEGLSPPPGICVEWRKWCKFHGPKVIVALSGLLILGEDE